MKNFIKTLFLFSLCIILFSCYSQKPLTTVQPENNGTYQVEYLFEHDGCKVYRFKDKGNIVYFTNCNGEAISIANDSTRTTNTIKVQN